MVNTAIAALMWFGTLNMPMHQVSSYRLPIKIPKELEGRITFYHRFQDRFGNKIAMDDDLHAKEGITAAADPSFPFGTKIYIPELKGTIGDGVFVIQDRGTAVTKKKASDGRKFVFDIYIEAKSPKEADRRLQKLIHTQDDYMKVYVIEG